MNQTTRQRITGSLVLAVTALILLPVIFDGEGSYQPAVQIDIPARPQQPIPAQLDPQRPVITADSDAIRIRPESPATVVLDNTEPVESDVTDEPVTQTGASPSDDVARVTVATTPAPTVTPAATPATTPSTTTATTPSPTPSPTPETTPSPTTAPVSSPGVTVAASNAAPATLDPQGLPEGWSVRLGSFSNTENATALVARLQAAGHRAYSRRVESSQGILTAVFVGPLVNRVAAQTLLELLRQDFQLNGMIVRYEIEPL
ncbi:MAG: SPOR domain-containing protein [Pseudohongiella sp.]|nr:SPOR domain-containing protein [Pseudohongiella sp.]